MKNLVKNIYIFSKLSLVFFLLSVLIFVAYIFYKSYSSQTKLSLDKNNEDKIIIGLIDQNKLKINNIGNNIKEINQTLLELKKIENLNSEKSDDVIDKTVLLIDNIKEEINVIKNDLKKIENKNNNEVSNDNAKKNIHNNNIQEILKLAKLKFEAGESFNNELEYLDYENNLNIKPFVEKLFIIESMKFKGSKTLLNIFENESSEFILEKIFKERPLIKNIFKYVKVQPSKKNNLYDKEFLNLNNLNELIHKKNYKKSINVLTSINGSDEYFAKSIEQLSIAKLFYETIDNILKYA